MRQEEMKEPNDPDFAMHILEKEDVPNSIKEIAVGYINAMATLDDKDGNPLYRAAGMAKAIYFLMYTYAGIVSDEEYDDFEKSIFDCLKGG